MDRDEIVKEIHRVEGALHRTESRKLRHDYGKHLKRLYQSLKYYDKAMEKYERAEPDTK